MAEEQDTFKEVYDNLWGAHERELIYYKVMESTLRGGAGQQERIMKEKDKRIEELEAQVKELQGWDFENIIDKIYGEQNLESPKDIRIKELEDKLSKAGEVVEDNVQTILRLQRELKASNMDIPDSEPLDVQGGTPLHVGFTHSMEHSEPLWHNPDILQCEICSDSEPFVPVATIPTDEYSVYLANKATGRGMVEYPFNPEGEKEPYPFTHPIRDIPAGGGRVSKKKAFLDDAFNYGISLEGVNVPIGEWGISY